MPSFQNALSPPALTTAERRPPRLAILKRLLGLLCVASLCLNQGCTSFTARIAGWYVARQIDSYLDLNGEQEDWLRPRVDQHLAKLRSRDLHQWIQLFRQLRGIVGSRATDANLKTAQERYDRLMDSAVEQLVPEIAQLVAQLDDDQIDHFARRMRETLDEVYEDERLPPKERRENLDEKLIEAIESLSGDLRPEQQQKILAAVHALPKERSVQYKVGKQRIHNGAQFLHKHPGATAIEAELHRLWQTRYQVLGAGRGKVARRAEQRGLLLVIDSTMSRQQRNHAVQELNGNIRKARRFLLPRETASN